MASSSWADHLTIITDTQIWCTHSINMLILGVVYEDNLSKPLTICYKLFHVLFTRAASMSANHSDEAINWPCFWRHRSWCRVLQQKFFHTFADVFSTECSFLDFITWSNKDQSVIIIKSLLLPPLIANILNCFFWLSSKISLGNVELITFSTHKMIEMWIRVDVLYSFPSSVLSNIVSRELIASCNTGF